MCMECECTAVRTQSEQKRRKNREEEVHDTRTYKQARLHNAYSHLLSQKGLDGAFCIQLYTKDICMMPWLNNLASRRTTFLIRNILFPTLRFENPLKNHGTDTIYFKCQTQQSSDYSGKRDLVAENRICHIIFFTGISPAGLVVP